MVAYPVLEDYDVSYQNGFLPSEAPLECLPGPHYAQWEYIVKNLQGLILSKRLHEVVGRMPILSTDQLETEPEWRRAYSALGFIAHAYIWGGNKPADRVPPSISVPFLETCKHLELPAVATYAGVVLWNWKPIFEAERHDTFGNLDTINTFTGAMDEKWFYIVSIAIEAKGAPIIPLMLHAIRAANEGDTETVTMCLRSFAERLDELSGMLSRMYDSCDPHVFYHHIRPFLAGSKNMADAGLPNGVIFDDGGPINKQRFVQFSGGSNAQSSIIQFFDLVLDVQHRPTQDTTAAKDGKKPAKPQVSFIHEMRKYMPGRHARFLEHVAKVANIRGFVKDHPRDHALAVAFDACLAMLSAFRDVHIQMVSRYIVVKSSQAKAKAAKKDDAKSGPRVVNLANRQKSSNADGTEKKTDLKGTGGSSLIAFLQQARNETGEPAVNTWTQHLLKKQPRTEASAGKEDEMVVQGLAGVWNLDHTAGGLCHW